MPLAAGDGPTHPCGSAIVTTVECRRFVMKSANTLKIIVLVCCAAALASSAWADQILYHSDHTSRTYRAAATTVQGLRALPAQRGVHLDGTMHHPPLHPMALAGN